VNIYSDVYHSSANRLQRQGHGLPRRLQSAALNLGFTSDQELPLENSEHSPALIVPEYGLSVPQMRVLGLTADGMTKVPEVEAVRFSLSISCCCLTFCPSILRL